MFWEFANGKQIVMANLKSLHLIFQFENVQYPYHANNMLATLPGVLKCF
uniref:Uncharacterized protein n=1 Tax=Arundo donax TaxID=35708 RepID=A0A0A9ACL2_ARUDO